MAKKFFSKALSVGLSLALCAGMVMPALAWAPLSDEYIDENGVLQGHDWEDGISYDYYLEDDYVLDQTLVVEDGVQAAIDLNGHDLKLNDRSEIIKDDDGYLEEIKVADSSGEVKEGSVIRVDGQDTKLTVYGNKEEKDAEYQRGEGKGGITGGNATAKGGESDSRGGGVNVDYGAAFEMFGGSIYGNKAVYGGGLEVWSHRNEGVGHVSLTDVDVSENYATGSGGGICFTTTTDFTMTRGSVSGNTAEHSGGGIEADTGSAKLKDVEVSYNTAETAGGIYVVDCVDFSMEGGSIHHNRVTDPDGGTIRTSDTWGIKLNGVAISDNEAEHLLTGSLFYYDYDSGWGPILYLIIDADHTARIHHCDEDWELQEVVVEFSFAEDASVEIDDHGDYLDNPLSVKGIESLTVYDAEGEPTTYEFVEGTKAVFHVDGTITIENGGVVKEDGKETIYVGGADVDGFDYMYSENNDGEVSIVPKGETITKTDDGDGSVTITGQDGDGEDKFEKDITLPDGKDGSDVTVDGEGTTNVPGGSKITGEDDSETTYPDGAQIDKDGNVTGATVTKTDDGDGNVTITTDPEGSGEGKDHEITLPKDENGETKGEVTVDGDGTTNVPEGGKITGEDGNETTYPNGTTIDKDGNVNGEKDDGTTDPSITKDKTTGDVTIDDGKGGETKVDVPDGGDAKVEVNDDGTVTVTVPDGGKVTDKDGNEIDLPDGGEIIIDKDGNVTLPKVDDDDDDNGGNNNGSSNVFENYDFGAGTTNIEDEAVPLAGIVFIQDVLAELYRRAGSPDGADAEGEYDRAVAWALANELIDDETDVEAVVTVAALRAILANHAKAFGANAVAAEDLTTLTGEDDDVVMNCDEVLAEFFGEEYVPAKDEEETAA